MAFSARGIPFVLASAISGCRTEVHLCTFSIAQICARPGPFSSPSRLPQSNTPLLAGAKPGPGAKAPAGFNPLDCLSCERHSLHPFQQLPRFTQQRLNLPSLGDRIPGEQAVLVRVLVCPWRAGSGRRRACGSVSCRAPPASGTRCRNGFWRHNAGSPASGRYCGRDRSCLRFPLGLGGIALSPGARALRRIPRRGCRALVRDDYARMLRDVADNGLAAIAHRHVPHGDGGLAMELR